MSYNGKAVAWTSICSTTIIIIVSGIVLSEHLIKVWYLRKLKSNDQKERIEAIVQLHKMDSTEIIILPIIREILYCKENEIPLNDKNAEFWILQNWLKELCVENEEAKLILMSEVTNPEKMVKIEAINLLSHLGPFAGEAIPVLRDALLDENEDVRGAAAEALEIILKHH